jgi:hypothetical protein
MSYKYHVIAIYPYPLCSSLHHITCHCCWQVESQLPSFIYFCGAPLEEVLAALQMTSSPPVETAPPLPQSLFDKLELIVFNYMKQKHFSSFQKSPYYTKYLSFMMLSGRHVTREDFTLFRVLGRGGFGIVYGCKKCQSGHLYALKVMDRKRIKVLLKSCLHGFVLL